MSDQELYRKWTEEARQDPRSVDELVQSALAAESDEAYHNFVEVLHWRATHEVFEAAKLLCENDEPEKRALGADIFGQLGIPERVFPDEQVAIIINLLQNEQNSEVLKSAAIASGHLRNPKAIEHLIRLKNHADENVRYGVVFGLLTYTDPQAIQALIELSRDRDEDTRDWATFGLGSMIDTDTPEIRQALFDRIADEDPEIRGEALVGLAIRHDERVLEPLIKELSLDSVGSLAVEAAAEIGESRLYPYLLELKQKCNAPSSQLEEAIEKCNHK